MGGRMDSHCGLPRFWYVWILLFCSGLAVLFSAACRPRGPMVPPGQRLGGEVHGYVYSTVGFDAQQRPDKLFLPDIEAFVSNPSTGFASAPVKTDLKGFFVLPRQPEGRYVVCVRAEGYATSCEVPVTVGSETAYAHDIPIRPLGPSIVGSVLVGTPGVPGNYDDRESGIRFWTTVTPVDAGGKQVGPEARANSLGRYLLPKVESPDGEVRAKCQEARAVQPFRIASPSRVNLKFSNQPPRNLRLSAKDASGLLRRASAGATVEVAASVEDEQGLDYFWGVSASGAPFKSTRADRQVQWTLPRTESDSIAYLTVADRNCGVRRQTLRLSTGASGVLFTGTVLDETGNPVSGARVRLQGKQTETSSDGGFLLFPSQAADRYALSISKLGYKGATEVTTSPVIGGTYRIDRVPAVSFDPVAGGVLVEIPRRRIGQSERPPARLTLPPNALERLDGSPPAPGLGQGFLAAIDLRDPMGRDFPGEYAGIAAGNREVALNSLGALDVQLTDSAGQPLQLRSGMTSEVFIPLDGNQMRLPGMPGTPPPSAPFWYLDPETGLWKEEGLAIRDGAFYKLVARHFSTINIDLEFTSPACMRIRSDLATLRLPYQLRVSVPAAAPVKVKTDTIADELSVLVRLPASTPVKLEILDSTGQAIASATQTVSTQASSSPIFPTYPEYGTCTSEAQLTIPVPPTTAAFLDYYGGSTAEEADAYYAKIDPTAVAGAGTVSSAGATVTGVATGFNGFIQPGHILRAGGQARLVQTVVSATELVTESPFNPALPPGTVWEKVGEKNTLDQWKNLNDFGSEDADAIYLNAGDLNLGRWMHMKNRGAGQVAYYVSNYGIPPNNGSADLAAAAKLAGNPALGLIATVAMEHTPHPTLSPASPYTKFYVFDANGNRINKADLDGGGNRYVPNLCIVCHAGNTSQVTGDPRGNADARFIFFDTKTFGYSGLGAAFTEFGQRGPFRELNRSVKDRTNVATATADVITNWYGGAGLPNADLDGAFVPADWAPRSSLYSDVVKPACRSCHATRDGSVSWAKWDDFNANGSSIYYRVCESRSMPQAVVTYKKLWLSTSPHMPNALGAAGLDTWNPGDPCPD